MVAPQQSHFPLILNYEFIIFLLKFHLNFVYQWYNKWGVENSAALMYCSMLLRWLVYLGQAAVKNTLGNNKISHVPGCADV
jgi:hypothetical protein